jgi:signal transduction histidine kinase
LPPDRGKALQDVRRYNVHVYEVLADERTYLCHVAALGKRRLEGWVVIANDVTELKEVDRLKSQMIRMTSHDLKNPLQAAMSYLELLIEDGQNVFTETMRADADMVWAQLNRMYRMINGILNLERAESGNLNFEPCELEDMLGRVTLDVADQARRKGLDLQLQIDEPLPLVMGDLHQLSQVFANLVDNAVKFSSSGDYVIVHAGISGRHVVVQIQDSGMGIPVDEQEHIFERFYRGRQGIACNDGSGLGLSIVKYIVERHNGNIKIESNVNEGTVVYVFLPIAGDGELGD